MLKRLENNQVIRAAAVYVAIAFVYVYLSDRFVEEIIENLLPKEQHLLAHTLIGWAFVGATGLYFYFILTSSALQTKKEREDREEVGRQLRILLENAPGVAYRCLSDAEWTMTYLSDGIMELSGYPPESFYPVGELPFEELIHPEDRDHVRRSVQIQTDTLRTFNLTYRIVHRDGSIRWVWERGQRVGYDQDGIAILEGYIVEITERIELSNRMSELNLRMNAMFHNAPSGILFTDGNRLTDVNPTALELLGYSREELLELKLDDLRPEKRQGSMSTAELTSLVRAEGRYSTTLNLQMKDGSTLPVNYQAVANVMPGMDMILFNDISDRLTYEKQLETQVRRFQALSKIGATLSRATSLELIYRTILTEAINGLGVDSGAILRYRPDQEALTYVAGLDLTSPSSQLSKEIPLGSSMAGKALITGRPIIIPDLRGAALNESFKRLAANEGFRSYAAFPLQAGGDYLGVIELFQRSDFSPDPEWQPFAQTLANDAAVGILATQTRINLETELRQTKALSNVSLTFSSSADMHFAFDSVLSEAIEAMGVDAGAILLVDENEELLNIAAFMNFNEADLPLSSIPIGESAAGKAAKTQESVYIRNIAELNDNAFFAALSNSQEFTSYLALPMLSGGRLVGVLEFFNRDELRITGRVLNFAQTLAHDAAIGIAALQTREKLRDANEQLLEAYETTLMGWGRALEYRDQETEGHSDRVTNVTVELARRFDLDEEELLHIRWGARLHDIGKMAIPDHILLKPGALTEEEWVVMRTHPVRAYEWLREVPFMGNAIDIPHYHHEKWDGSGYPAGLKGAKIPLSARIFAIVDVWDALSHDRPYRNAWPMNEVITYIRDQRGKHFDPDVVDAFLDYLTENGVLQPAELNLHD